MQVTTKCNKIFQIFFLIKCNHFTGIVTVTKALTSFKLVKTSSNQSQGIESAAKAREQREKAEKARSNQEAVARFREKEKRERAEREIRQRKIEETRKENERKKMEIENIKRQIEFQKKMNNAMKKNHPKFPGC